MSQFRRVSIRGQIRIKNKLQQQFNLSPDVLLLLGIINPFSRAPKAIGNRAIPSQFRRHQQLYFLFGEPLMPLSSFFFNFSNVDCYRVSPRITYELVNKKQVLSYFSQFRYYPPKILQLVEQSRYKILSRLQQKSSTLYLP